MSYGIFPLQIEESFQVQQKNTSYEQALNQIPVSEVQSNPSDEAPVSPDVFLHDRYILQTDDAFQIPHHSF